MSNQSTDQPIQTMAEKIAKVMEEMEKGWQPTIATLGEGAFVSSVFQVNVFDSQTSWWRTMMKNSKDNNRIRINAKAELITWVNAISERRKRAEKVTKLIATNNDPWDVNLTKIDTEVSQMLTDFQAASKQLMANVVASLVAMGPIKLACHFLLSKTYHERYWMTVGILAHTIVAEVLQEWKQDPAITAQLQDLNILIEGKEYGCDIKCQLYNNQQDVLQLGNLAQPPTHLDYTNIPGMVAIEVLGDRKSVV